ncbi:MAG: hypothetical protein GY754_37760 [bacterium]|nr:hypothetical protein [bacterium]
MPVRKLFLVTGLKFILGTSRLKYVTIIGGVVRSIKSIKLNIKSFQLDNNGFYHLLLIISFILMFKGIMNLNEFKILITAF